MSRNVTIDPLTQAAAVGNPEINEIMSFRTGRFFDAVKFITSRRHDTIVNVRNKLREELITNTPRLRCAKCLSEVYLVASTRKAFFFRHRREDGSCPAITRAWESQDQIRAAKYAGAQESRAHKRVKHLLMRSIAADPRFSLPAEERTWKSIVQPGRYRRPDVSAKLGDLWIAFEAQLSTTFLSVVVERRAFYKADGGLLVWVLSRFDPNDRRLTEDDLIFPNNSNILVVDDETAALSEVVGRLMVKVHYRVPNVCEINGGAVWASRLAGFDELFIDLESQRAFLVDVEEEERTRDRKLREECLAADEVLRQEFLAHVSRPREQYPPYDELLKSWEDFTRRFAQRGVTLPAYSKKPHDFDQPLKAILSARDGVPVGWNFEALIQIAHHLFKTHPRHLLLFGFALRAYGRDGILETQDSSGKWRPKARQFKAAVIARHSRFDPELNHQDLIEFLFPKPMALLQEFLIKKRREAA